MSGGKKRPSLQRAWVISAASGFLALAWEIVWMRLYNFTTSSRAIAFGMMLGAYLLGLAIGSLWSRRWHRLDDDGNQPLAALATLIQRANVAAFMVVPVASWLVMVVWWPWTLLTVMLAAAVLGTILPMLCHIAIPPDGEAGRRMAGIYLANIIGSGLGSLITGFFFMEYLTLQWLCLLLFCMAQGLAMYVSWGSDRPAAVTVPMAALVLLGAFLGYAGLWERLQYRDKYQWGMQFVKAIESRHGVITVDSEGTIYGNSAYDGSLDVRLHDGSWLVRPYFIGALHPNPKKVLVIGVSGGAWTQIFAHHPTVEEVIGVEISEPYLRLIHDSPTVSSLMTNPKVKIVVDDGRRWLKRNPTERFDLIVMNTTHHWREFASALLSREFLELANTHLNEGGLVAWNCTESARAAKTGMTVFPHSVMLMNFFVGSQSPIVPHKARWSNLLQKWSIDGKPVFDLQSPEGRGQLEKCMAYADNEGPWDSKDHAWRWMNRARMEERFGSAEIITDDNLGHEFAWGNW